jgi:Tfp pilus assembly protein PilX
MNMKQKKQGSSLVMVVILLGVASLIVGVVLASFGSYTRIATSNYESERAMYLADAGLRVAMLNLVDAGEEEEAGISSQNSLSSVDEGVISLAESKSYFSDQDAFGDATWGFSTRLQAIGTNTYIISTGVYQTHSAEVQVAVEKQAASEAIHAIYSHALFVGNSSGDDYTLEVGGSGSYADFVDGDVYSAGNIDVSGDASLRLPEIINEVVYDDIFDADSETWQDAYATEAFTNGLSQEEYDAYVLSVSAYKDDFYGNGIYDYGEPYADTQGNGVYDEGEAFVDSNGNGVRDSGDGYIDNNNNGIYDEGTDTIIDNGNGEYDDGEEWVEDSSHSQRQNGKYDPAGGYWLYDDGEWSWEETYTTWYWSRRGWKSYTYSCSNWDAEEFEDEGDDNFDPGESWADGNGIYDEGEDYLDDRNGTYDYGTQAYGTITGMPSPGAGQRAADGGDSLITAPDLEHMYYAVQRDSYEPYDALERWGHDVAVTASDYSSNGKVINSTAYAEHIFVRNVRQSPEGGGNGYYKDSIGGVTVRSREYDLVYDNDGNRVDDYFLEDPTDSYYESYDTRNEIDGTIYTAPSYINVRPAHNDLLYYVDGNVYLHASPTWCLKFKEPGTRITIVAKGNITISDEFYYNADYDSSLDREDVDSTIVDNPYDALCLIALKNSNCPDSGNIYIGDSAYGTGGSIHAMLYAENEFVDNNLNTADQPFISIFGNMTAGDRISLNRDTSGSRVRTRLDVTLDGRIRDGELVMPGLPHPVSSERGISESSSEWTIVSGSWESWSSIK